MNAPPPRRRPPYFLFVLLGILALALTALIVNHQVGFSFGMPNEDFARAAMLVAILVFVGAGILGRHLRAFEVLRSMAVWALIILGVAGIYASRDQLAGFAGRLVGAIAPGIPVTGSLAGTGSPDSVMVVRAQDGHFGVRSSVNDTPVTMLLDTGASFVTLTHDDAIRVGIDADGLDYSVPIRTANGPMTAASVILDSVAVGPIERRQVPSLVAPRGSLEQSLLGMTFLDTLHGYSISGDRLTLKSLKS